jgi:hypothetical protein
MIKGCTVDLFDTVDGKHYECVLDTGEIEHCIYAIQIERNHNCKDLSPFKHECKYWRPETTVKEPSQDYRNGYADGYAEGYEDHENGVKFSPREWED